MSLKRVNFSPLHTFARATVKNVFQPEPDGFGGTDYILKEAASGAPAFAWNPETGESLGLSIEEARTNLLTYSQAFNDASWLKLGLGAGTAPDVTANAGVAPDGTMTADRIVFATGGATASDRSIIRKSVASGTVRRFSIFLKSNTGLPQIISLHNGGAASQVTVTNEWKRFDLEFATDRVWAGLEAEGSLTDSDVDILVWQAQLEVGSNASSPIYTEATTVTRLADVVTVPDLSGWYNASEGTFVFEFDAALSSANAYAATFTNGGGLSERIIVGKNTSNNVIVTGVKNNVVSAIISTAYVGGNVKIAFSYIGGTLKASVNGGAVSSAANAIDPALLTRLSVGSQNGATLLNGSISYIDYTPEAVTNAELIARSTL